MNEVFSSNSFSTNHLDYLQRNRFKPGRASGAETVPAALTLWHIEGMARPDKPKGELPNTEQLRTNGQDVLSGLYGNRLPFVFILTGTPKGVSVLMGTWRGADGLAHASSQDDQNVLRALLQSLYPAIKVTESDLRLKASPMAGFAMGIPSRGKTSREDTLPFDRLIRAMSGTNWAIAVIAQPLQEEQSLRLRDSITNEMRSAMTAAQDKKEPSPLANQYAEQLLATHKSYSAGIASGAWRTGVYLLGNSVSYPRLAGVWQSVFAGDESIPEAVRVFPSQDAGGWAANLSLPDDPCDAGPGFFRYPYQFQTILNSAQLALYTQLPSVETSGFYLRVTPEFDVVPPPVREDGAIALGTVMERDTATSSLYRIAADALTKHVFVAGVTGAGKTNTIFVLLKEAALRNIPFLVVEPAKTEYRALMNDKQFSSTLRVFTLGNERVSPFRFNPFEVLPEIGVNEGEQFWPIALHLDLLRSVFSVSFGMWNPLPQVLERCLQAIYEDRGWEISSGQNRRLRPGESSESAFPTLSDLQQKVEEVTASLGYEEKIASDIRAALKTRIDSLRNGGKGRMLDVQHSVDMEALLNGQVVLELEGLGDDDDKAFVMGLVFIRLIELRRSQGQHVPLRHLMVIEEAHRLLTNVSTDSNQEEGNPRGKAVETFTGLLSEIRSYGQGIIIADQVPVRLAPDVMKNSNLKIAHRIVATDDRDALAGTMAMAEGQSEVLAMLSPGRAAVFSDGDDRPVLVQIANVKSALGDTWPTNNDVTRKMRELPALDEALSNLPLQLCADHCELGPSACLTARTIAEHPRMQSTFARLVLSAMEDSNAVPNMWEEVLVVIRMLRPAFADLKEEHLAQCVSTRLAESYAERRGAQLGWTYAETASFAAALRNIIGTHAGEPEEGAWEAFQQRAFTLHERTYNPYPGCSLVCRNQKSAKPVCLYRKSVSDVIQTKAYDAQWRAASAEDQRVALQDPSKSGRRKESWDVCASAAAFIIQWPIEGSEAIVNAAAHRTALCFAQQMLAQEGKPLFIQEQHFTHIYSEGTKPNA